MKIRETAWRLFSTEMNSSSLEKKGTEEKSPSYLVTRLGAMVNRVLVAGVLTEKENVGSEDEPMWKARIEDVSGSFFVNVGRFQPEAAAAMADLEVPSFVAVVGKVRTYTTDDQRVFVSVRPERIVTITEETRKRWVLEAAQSMWKRINDMKRALAVQDASAEDLVAKGFSPQEAEGIVLALDTYGFPDSVSYLKSIHGAMRMLLPDRNVDLGLPEDLSDYPDEMDIGDGESSADREDVIMGLLEELDTDGKGAPRDELERRAEAEGISGTELEEISNALMDKGLVYEPNLRYLKRI